MKKFEINLKRRNVPQEELLNDLKRVAKLINQQTVTAVIYDEKGRFGKTTILRRFGSWNKALEASGLKVILTLNNKEEVLWKINWRLRATVLIRDNCICKMCGASPAKNPSVELHIDHIKPWSKGGETEMENLRTLCSVCNVGRSNVV